MKSDFLQMFRYLQTRVEADLFSSRDCEEVFSND